MKKLLFAASALALMSAMSCTSTTTDTVTEKIADDACAGCVCPYPELYQGLLPAADAEGAQYRLVVESGCGEIGSYALRTDYIGAPAPGNVYLDSGTVSRKVVDSVAVVTLKSVVPGNEAMNFRVNADGSLTMLGSDLEAPVVPGDYTLVRVI